MRFLQSIFQTLCVIAINLAFSSSLLHAQTVDVDGDGIPDAVEIEVGLDPNNAMDAYGDLDEDGWTNIDEYRMATAIDDVLSSPADYANRPQKLFAQEQASYDNLGYSVAISGDIQRLVIPPSSLVSTEPFSGSQPHDPCIASCSKSSEVTSANARPESRKCDSFATEHRSVLMSGGKCF